MSSFKNYTQNKTLILFDCLLGSLRIKFAEANNEKKNKIE